MRKQYAFLLAKSTEMRKHSSIMRKQYAFLLIEIDLIKIESRREHWGLPKNKLSNFIL